MDGLLGINVVVIANRGVSRRRSDESQYSIDSTTSIAVLGPFFLRYFLDAPVRFPFSCSLRGGGGVVVVPLRPRSAHRENSHPLPPVAFLTNALRAACETAYVSPREFGF